MCLRPRVVYTVCAHTDELGQEDCMQVQIMKAARQLGALFIPRWMRSSCGPTWARPLCTARVDYRLAYDFCATCRVDFAVPGELTETRILKYWAYKNSQGMRQPVESAAIPPGIFSGSLDAIGADPQDLRLETITLSEALHIWDQPGPFFRSQAYSDGNRPLNLIGYLEEIRSRTLLKARRTDCALSLPAPASEHAGCDDDGPRDAEAAITRSEGPSTASVPAPIDRLTKMRERLSVAARATSYALNPAMVYEGDDTNDANARACVRLPKGREKAVDTLPPSQYRPPQSVNSAMQDYEAARRASVTYLLNRTYSGGAGPSKVSTGSSEQVPVQPRNPAMFPGKDAIPHKPTPVVSVKSSVPSPLCTTEAVYNIDYDGYETDYTEYDSDKSPRNSTWDSGRPDSDILPPNILPQPITPVRSLVRSATRASEYQTRFDRPDSPVLPVIFSPRPANDNRAFAPSAFHPLHDLPADISSDTSQDSLSQRPRDADADSNTCAPTASPDQPLRRKSNDSLPSALAQHMADIDALFPHQFRPPSGPASEADSASSSPVLFSPLSVDAGCTFYDPRNPDDHSQTAPTASPAAPLTAPRIATAARHALLPYPLPPATFASPQPRAPARVGTPSLARTSSAELQALYRAAIRDGRAVLHAPVQVRMGDDRDGGGGGGGGAAASRRKRNSAVGLVLPATTTTTTATAPESAGEEEEKGVALHGRTQPGSAPPFPSRGARPFEEVAVTAVCLCREVGRRECLCPRVVQPVAWM